MTIALFLFPYLVYDIIFKQVDLHDRLALATLSKRTRWNVKKSFRKRQFKLHIGDNKIFTITPDVGNKFTIDLRNFLHGYMKKYRVYRHVLIPREAHGWSQQGALKKYLDWNVLPAKLTQFLIDTFPNLAITMTLHGCRGNIHSSAEVIRKSNVPIDHMLVICRNQQETLDILPNCVTLKTLQIYGDLEDPTAILPSLQCDLVKFEGKICCAEQIVQVFMNCKRFVSTFHLKRFNTPGLVLIFEAWKNNNSRLDYIKLNCRRGAYRNVIKMMEGEPRKLNYRDKALDCYLIRQPNGKEAVIYSASEKSKVIELRTDFELIEDS